MDWNAGEFGRKENEEFEEIENKKNSCGAEI
jgi:hypothetical protein